MIFSSRKKFGPDLQFVVLYMDLDEQVERIKGRHGNDPDTIEIMKVGRRSKIRDFQRTSILV